MTAEKAQRLSIRETPLEILQQPPFKQNLLAPFPNVGSPAQLSGEALSSMVASPCPSFALTSIRMAYSLSPEVARYAMSEQAKNQRVDRVLVTGSSDKKGVSFALFCDDLDPKQPESKKPEVSSTFFDRGLASAVGLGKTKTSALMTILCKTSKHLLPANMVMAEVISLAPGMNIMNSIFKTYLVAKAAWRLGNTIRRKLIERSAAKASTDYKLAYFQTIAETATKNYKELDYFVTASSDYSGDLAQMLTHCSRAGAMLEAFLDEFKGSNLERIHIRGHKGVFGGAKDFVFGKKRRTEEILRETRVLKLTLPSTLKGMNGTR
jgi:hypothetical protein